MLLQPEGQRPEIQASYDKALTWHERTNGEQERLVADEIEHLSFLFEEHYFVFLVDDAIARLGSVEAITVQDEERVTEVRRQVDYILAQSFSTPLTQHIHLQALEARIAELKYEPSLKEQLIFNAEEALIRLPMDSSITLEHEAQIVEARQYVNAAKSFGHLFLNEWKLERAEHRLEQLQQKRIVFD